MTYSNQSPLSKLCLARYTSYPYDYHCGAFPHLSSYHWALGDDIAHNGDPTTYCFAFYRNGEVMNLGNPVDEMYCGPGKPDLAAYRWILADHVAHNGDSHTYCFALNSSGQVLNSGNRVDDWHCERNSGATSSLAKENFNDATAQLNSNADSTVRTDSEAALKAIEGAAGKGIRNQVVTKVIAI